MYIKELRGLILFVICYVLLPVFAADNPYEFIVTNNKDIEAKMTFLDKLGSCEPYEYNEKTVGSYKINGKINSACSVRWIMANCYFPEGVYQEFSRVQKIRTIERLNRLYNGYRIELKDKNYRYLLYTGNKYCTIFY